MDVNLDEMTEEISERIANLKTKKIRIRERLKAIETKSEGLISRWQEQLGAIEAVKLLANELAIRNRDSQTSPIEVSPVAEVQSGEDSDGLRADDSVDPREFPQKVTSYVKTLPEIDSFKGQPDTSAGEEVNGSDSLGSLKEQLAAENAAASRLFHPDENVNLRV